MLTFHSQQGPSQIEHTFPSFFSFFFLFFNNQTTFGKKTKKKQKKTPFFIVSQKRSSSSSLFSFLPLVCKISVGLPFCSILPPQHLPPLINSPLRPFTQFTNFFFFFFGYFHLFFDHNLFLHPNKLFQKTMTNIFSPYQNIMLSILQ